MRGLPDILRGCKVFPCVEGGKEPATTGGWHEATDDPAQIERWQRINPNFNWAIATGLSNLFVIDVDPQGLDWWAKLLERDPAIREAVSAAYQVRTPRGGLHVYFRGEGPSTASRIADGIDTRGGIKRNGKIVSGGYVLLPGSKTSAGVYSELPGGRIEDLPSVVRGIVPERKKTDTLGLAKNPEHDQPRNIQWATDLLKNFVKTGKVSKEGSGGDSTAFSVTCAVLDKGISPGLALDLLEEHWNPFCQPPWDSWELEIKVKNAAEYGEDTGAGVKGFQTNADAFAAFAGMEVVDIATPKAERSKRDRLQWIHDYADSVGDPEWLIPGIIPTQGTGMIFGESGSYKSFCALDMALCLAFGIPGQWGAPDGAKTDVLFFAGEGPRATAKLRMPSWMLANDIEFRNDHRCLFKDRVPFYSDVQEWENIKEDLGAMKAKPRLIVIDTLSRLITGMDENSTKDATVITHFLEQLASYYECFVLVVHHTGKDQTKGARGSSAFFANMDVALSTKKLSSGGMEFRVKKQKDADVDDATRYFEIKPYGQSIVLKQSTDRPQEEGKAGKPRYEWATVQEVIKVLEGMGGATSAGLLAQEIAGAHGLDRNHVTKVLNATQEIQWLKPAQGQWAIPKTEPDL